MNAVYVSTGELPPADVAAALVDEAYLRFRADHDGEVSDVYPALAGVPADLFGVCVTSVAGASHAAGDVDAEFTIMSVAKPFVFALVCDAVGAGEAGRLVGVDATGLPFNSLAAVEQRAHQPDGQSRRPGDHQPRAR